MIIDGDDAVRHDIILFHFNREDYLNPFNGFYVTVFILPVSARNEYFIHLIQEMTTDRLLGQV